MEVRCDKCQARYRVDDARIGPQGLTMRCGKCQNTFKVTKAAGDGAAKPAAAPKPAAPAPRPTAEAAALADESAGATMMFQTKPAPKPAPVAAPSDEAAGATMMFQATKPAPAGAAKPAAAPAKPVVAKPAAPAAAAAPADEGAGRTMMFQTGNLKSAPGVKPPAKAEAEPVTQVQNNKKPAGESDAGSTMVFGQSPLAAQGLTAKPPVANASDEVPGATMMFGNGASADSHMAAPAVQMEPPEPAKPEDAAPAEAEAPAESEPPQHEHVAADEATADEPATPETTQESEPDEYANEAGVHAEGAEAAPEEEEGTFDKAPPKGLLIGVIAGVGLVIVALAALLVVKKMGSHPPPPAVVEAMTAAQAEADQDTVASLGSAESKAKAALEDAGPKVRYPEGAASYARIEIQLADALTDDAQAYADKSSRESDDTKRAADDAKVQELSTQAKSKLKAAFETLAPAIKADPKSPDLQLALADYYRAQRSNSNMNKALKAAQANHADDAKVAFIQGLAAEQEDDGAERAIPKLKTALAANPQSARIHYRVAVAYTALKDDVSTRSELKETLKLSPSHDRAKAALEALGPEQK
jgi:predicted Zn finger-like uncharacterized protein